MSPTDKECMKASMYEIMAEQFLGFRSTSPGECAYLFNVMMPELAVQLRDLQELFVERRSSEFGDIFLGISNNPKYNVLRICSFSHPESDMRFAKLREWFKECVWEGCDYENANSEELKPGQIPSHYDGYFRDQVGKYRTGDVVKVSDDLSSKELLFQFNLGKSVVASRKVKVI